MELTAEQWFELADLARDKANECPANSPDRVDWIRLSNRYLDKSEAKEKENGNNKAI